MCLGRTTNWFDVPIVSYVTEPQNGVNAISAALSAEEYIDHFQPSPEFTCRARRIRALSMSSSES
jgi:hypothetical protein